MEVLLKAHALITGTAVPVANLPVADRRLIEIALELVGRGARRLEVAPTVIVTCPLRGLALEEYDGCGLRFDSELELLPVDASLDDDALTARAGLRDGGRVFDVRDLPGLYAFAVGQPSVASLPHPQSEAMLTLALNSFWAAQHWPFHGGRRLGNLVAHVSATPAAAAARRSYLGAGCTVDGSADLDSCVVMAGASVGAGCRLQACILLPSARVPDGVQVAHQLFGWDGWLRAEARRLAGHLGWAEKAHQFWLRRHLARALARRMPGSRSAGPAAVPPNAPL